MRRKGETAVAALCIETGVRFESSEKCACCFPVQMKPNLGKVSTLVLLAPGEVPHSSGSRGNSATATSSKSTLCRSRGGCGMHDTSIPFSVVFKTHFILKTIPPHSHSRLQRSFATLSEASTPRDFSSVRRDRKWTYPPQGMGCASFRGVSTIPQRAAASRSGFLCTWKAL